MPTADTAAQRALLELARTDFAVETATMQRKSLPEISVVTDGTTRMEKLSDQVALAEAEVGDIDSAAKKLDGEIDLVRSRASRDHDRLASGAIPPKELESLQREVESLARRQASLEDDALELMERREGADVTLVEAQEIVGTLRSEVADATTRRDDTWADIDDELARLATRRGELVAAIPDDVLALYERVRGSGKTAAGALTGDRCGACQMTLDRQSLDAVHAAADDSIQRCPECSAILIRTK